MAETDLVINEGQTISGKVCENIWKQLIIRKQLNLSKTGLKTMRLLVNQTLLPYTIILRGILPKESWPLSLAITIKDFILVNQRLFLEIKGFNWYEQNKK
jgi:hypothetical protein